MAASTDNLRVRQHDQAITFLMEGDGRMAHGLAMRRFVAKALAGGAQSLRVDLRRCTYMDSTFLGTLLYLHHTLQRRKSGEFALVSPSPACLRLFQQMGLEDAYTVVTADELP